VLSSDCTNCGRCIDICDDNIYHFGLRFPNIVPHQGQKSEGKELTDAA